MICSVLIPSRARFTRLKAAIDSLKASATDKDSFEVLVRFDDDDEESRFRYSELQHFPPVTFWWGPRPKDWDEVCKVLFKELAHHSKAEWLWAFSDDMTIKGNGWDTQLKAMPDNVWVQPDKHILGGSGYNRDSHAPAPIIRRSFWEAQGKFPLIDFEIWEHCEKAGLKLRWLDHVSISHQRGTDEELASHRKH